DMPEPGESRAARFEARLIDPVWDGLYAPIGRGLEWLTLRANALQFLTIRRYLTLVFAALIVLLIAVVLSE
ncbi:MAG TPA: hydrogenase 4 subunit B, partial [Alphaproteobacteria bacterium]|nr:hydrogenase 4 subunit B [Alphaproteobacteria bacterium]